MALLNCPACQHQISDTACWCPHCGLPKEYYTTHVLRRPISDGTQIPLELIARGYRVETIEPEMKKIFLLGGECIGAEYYDQDLMIIGKRKVLGSLLGTVFSEEEPFFQTTKIPIISRKLPAHGLGQIIGAYRNENGIQVVVEFAESTLLKLKTNKYTYWGIECFCDENLISPDFPLDVVRELITANLGTSISNESLDAKLSEFELQRISILSKQRGRAVYRGYCKECFAPINSVDNQLCDICESEYVCNNCGYCGHCHSSHLEDPAIRDARIYSRLSEEEWNEKLKECEEIYLQEIGIEEYE